MMPRFQRAADNIRNSDHSVKIGDIRKMLWKILEILDTHILEAWRMMKNGCPVFPSS